MDELLKNLLLQAPTIALLWLIMQQQTKAHQESVNYYRAELAALYRMVLTKYLENVELPQSEIETLTAKVESLKPRAKP